LSAAGASAPVASVSRPRRLRVGFGWAFAAIVGTTVVAFAHSYADLSPLLASESPESLLLLIPFAAAFLLWRGLRDGGRDGDEVSVNFFFAIPLLIVLLSLLLWFPARLSYFYWVYRLDLLAVPFFVAIAVLVVFGATALWRARWAIVLLLLGWPPLLDSFLGRVTEPLSVAQAAVLRLLPLPAAQIGTTFLIHHGPRTEALTIGAPCSGLLAILSMILAGGLVVTARDGSRRRKLAWVATAVALALLANVVRLALVVVVAAHAGLAEGFVVFHALAGPLLFGATFICALQLLTPFGLRHRDVVVADRRRRPVELARTSAATVGIAVVALAGVAAWSIGAVPTSGLFRDAVVLDASRLLPLPAGYRNGGVSDLASLGNLFGDGARAQLAHIEGVRGDAVAAQVVVTGSYRSARAYNVLDCFVFHHAHVYSTRVSPLVAGGSAIVTAIRIDHADVATATWIQPALIGDRRTWRRVVLFAYLDGATRADATFHPATAETFGSWLLDRFGPYGTTKPPDRFRRAERSLLALADRLVQPEGAGV
jgi:exosortase/archaeosortase family protein